MKITGGSKIKLGVLVSASIAIFIIGIYFVGERQQLFRNTFHVSGIFHDISGLQVGNNVRFSGINVGIIEDIQQITDTTVRVDMNIDEGTRKFIKTNAKALIGSDGLMGSKIVLIIPGVTSTAIISDNGILETSQPVNMDDILVKLKVTSENAALMTGDLAGILQHVHEGKGTIGKLLMDSVLAENVSRAMINIKQGAGGFKQNMDAAGHNFLLRGHIKKKEKEDQKIKDDKKEKALEEKKSKESAQ
jgi:phospholipid/cholesterol/gamma-HCH transport system substrate-binding protein